MFRLAPGKRAAVVAAATALLALGPAGSGGPADWRRQAEEWQALGASHLSVNTMGGGLAGPDAHIERVARAKDALAGL